MTDRFATAVWDGTIREGKGSVRFGSFEAPYSYKSRFEDASGTNPEELIAAAHAACFGMAVASGISRAGYIPAHLEVKAKVSLEPVEGSMRITKSHLSIEARVDGMGEAEFKTICEGAEKGCPVSVALAGLEISMDSTLNK